MNSLHRIHHRSHHHHHTQRCYPKRANTTQQAPGIIPSAVAFNAALHFNARGAQARGVQVHSSVTSVHHTLYDFW